MPRSSILRSLACVALLAGQSACGLLEPDELNELTLHVAPHTVDCSAVGPRQCLLVKEQAEGEWSYFYGSIDGFTFEPGYSYTLLVAWQRVPDPPADGSSRECRLLRIVSRVAAPAA